MVSSSNVYYGDFMSRKLESIRMSLLLQAWKVSRDLQPCATRC